MRKFIQSRPGLAVSVKVALTVLAHCKPSAAAAAGSLEALTKNSTGARSKKLSVLQYADDVFESGSEVAKRSINTTRRAWGRLVFAASVENQAGTPMTYEEVKLWLQSYNAGPYACLKYKGEVPFKETRNYVPRIMKFYQQDLRDSEYDQIIVEKARKYGLDPQLIRAVMKAESDFKVKTVSHAGARGLMQVMPCVWAEVKKRYDFDWEYDAEVFQPEKNIEVACAYLAWLRYDFLPRHFEEFSSNPSAPALVKRDRKSIPTQRISVAREIELTNDLRKGKSRQPGV